MGILTKVFALICVSIDASVTEKIAAALVRFESLVRKVTKHQIFRKLGAPHHRQEFR